MELTQLANLGEFVGGVAVLATLAYLAIQVRQGAVAQRAATEIAAGGAIQDSVNRWSDYRQMIIDENTGSVWAKRTPRRGVVAHGGGTAPGDGAGVGVQRGRYG